MNDGYDDEYQYEEIDEPVKKSSKSTSSKKIVQHNSPSPKEQAGKVVKATGDSVQASGAAIQTTGQTTAVAGAGTEMLGKGAQVAGTAASAAGDAMIKAGSRLSSTGVGAIIGAPMVAAGVAAKATGEATKVAGKGAEVAGKGVKNAGKKVNNAGRNVRKKGKKISEKGKKLINEGKRERGQNPLSAHNNFKNFAGNIDASDPEINSSSSILDGKKSFFGRNGINSFPSLNSGFSRKKSDKMVSKTSIVSPFALFAQLPLFAKVIVIGMGGFIIFVPLFILLVALIYTADATGNRELKNDYILGDYTDEELCDYLDRNGYLDSIDISDCEDSPSYQFYKNFKEAKENLENKYSRYRFSVNVELLYETLAYYSADDETTITSTKDEIDELMEAMREDITETCVVKSYNKNTKVCTTTKYMYDLHEYSLNKYISYLRYGKTSSHPNYSGKNVERKCGEGTNVDYVFGYGLVNTSSSPITESSDCPGNPVVDADYTNSNVTVKKTSLEEMDLLGGVPYFSHVNYTSTVSDQVNLPGTAGITNITVPGTGKGKDIAEYALQFVGNPYVYGGVDLEKGADCSGFVMSIFKNFGYSLPHSADSISKMGTKVECNELVLQPGDVIGYGNASDTMEHIAIYVGNGKIVHAMGAKWGIVVSNYDYSSRPYKVCRRIAN